MLLNTISETGYFMINKEIFAEEISSNAKLVYMYLSKCADAMGKSWPSHKDIASKCTMSVTAVKDCLKSLIGADLVKSYHRNREEGGKSSNMYMLTNKKYENVFIADPKVFALQISAKAKLIYLYFCRCADKKSTCFPSHRNVAEQCLMAVSTARKAIKELIDSKIITAQAQARKNKGQTSNLYTIFIAAVAQINETVNEVVEAVCETVETAKKNGIGTTFKNFLSGVQSIYNSRGYSQIKAGVVSDSVYERTTPMLKLSRMNNKVFRDKSLND